MKFRPACSAFALVLAACAPDPAKLQARAAQEYAAHDFKAAQLDLATVLTARPADPAALELHARTSLALGDGVGAEASLEALPAHHRPADYALLLGEAALLRKQPREALAAAAQDRSAEGARIRAMAALLDGDEARAAAEFAAGEGASGPSARLLADHARFLVHKGHVAEAQALAAKALKADPNSLDARLVSAQLSVASGDLAGGLAGYDAVAKAWPGNLAALIGKASVLGDLGRTAEMEDVLAQATKAGVSDPALIWLQGRTLAAKGDWQGTRDLLQANEEALAGRSDAQVLYAAALVQLGQPEQARARLQPLLTRNPGDLTVRRALAHAAMAAKDPRGAVEALRPLATQPNASIADLRLLAQAAQAANDPDAQRLAARAKFPAPEELGRTLAEADTAMKAHNWGNAIAAYEHIMALTDGKNALVLNNLAFAQSQVGNKKAALDYALRALKLAPDNPSVMDTAAWLLVETGGDRTRALQLLRTAAQKAPANQTIRQHLASASR